MTWVELLAQSAWRGSIILLAAFAAVAGLRRASAAVRHFMWTATLAAMVVLPVALFVAPKWSWRVEKAERVRVVVVTQQQAGAVLKATGAPPTTSDWLLGLWVLGFAVVGARFLVGAGRASWMAPRAAEARHAGAMLEELRRALGFGGGSGFWKARTLPCRSPGASCVRCAAAGRGAGMAAGAAADCAAA